MVPARVTDLLERVGILDMPQVFLSPSSRVYWLALLAGMGLAGLVYLFGDERARRGFGLVGFLAPWKLWSHPSAVLDYKIWFLNWIGLALLAPWMISGGAVTAWALGLLRPSDGPAQEMSAAWFLAYLVVFALAWDFAFYATHALRHKIPVLWAFHSVHHTARVLTPMSLYRGHLVELLWVGLALNLATGLAGAGFLLLVPHRVPLEQLVQGAVVLFVFNVLGANLRHSHVWLSYGRVLSHLLVSPAMHQIHHSRDPRHVDKNHGSMFAIWDWMFGTLYIPDGYEEIDYGVDPETDARHTTVWALVVEPFRDVATALGLIRR